MSGSGHSEPVSATWRIWRSCSAWRFLRSRSFAVLPVPSVRRRHQTRRPDTRRSRHLLCLIVTRLAPWHCGTVAPWHPGTLALWHLGTLALWHLGTLSPLPSDLVTRSILSQSHHRIDP